MEYQWSPYSVWKCRQNFHIFLGNVKPKMQKILSWECIFLILNVLFKFSSLVFASHLISGNFWCHVPMHDGDSCNLISFFQSTAMGTNCGGRNVNLFFFISPIHYFFLLYSMVTQLHIHMYIQPQVCSPCSWFSFLWKGSFAPYIRF